MNFDTVNELIQSLESAGELSIKERKYLELAKAYADKEAERVAQALTFEKCRELSGCPAGVDLQDWVKMLVSELSVVEEIHNNAVFITDELYDASPKEVQNIIRSLACMKIPAYARLVAGIKADGVAEREKTITFTAAKKRTQDGVALIAIGKPYKIHNDDVIGEFFIGERGRYGVITMDRLDYFTTSEEYAWEFSLREGADK